MKNTLIIVACACVIFGFVSGFGCNSNPRNLLPVTGTVSLDGKPIESGSIAFESVSGEIRSGTVITNGHFALKTENGLPSGDYKIEISAVEEIPGKTVETMAGPMPGKRNIVPEDYLLGKHVVTVKPNEKNTFDIDMKSKP